MTEENGEPEEGGKTCLVTALDRSPSPDPQTVPFHSYLAVVYIYVPGTASALTVKDCERSVTSVLSQTVVQRQRWQAQLMTQNSISPGVLLSTWSVLAKAQRAWVLEFSFLCTSCHLYHDN